MIGANKSAEGQEDDEGVEEQGQSGCNIVINNRLVELPIELKKKEYGKYIKAYIGKVLKKIEKERPGDVTTFKTNAQKAVKRILDSFDEWQFFYAEGADFDITEVDKFDGMLALMAWKDEKTPYMLFFKDGIEEEKAVRFFCFGYLIV